MRNYLTASITALLLLCLTSHGSAQELVPTEVTSSDTAPDWTECAYAKAGGHVYALTLAGVWRLLAGKAERVKAADGTDFVPTDIRLTSGHQKFWPVDNGLVVPGPHKVTEGRNASNGSAWIIRGAVAKPLLNSADGSPLLYQSLGNNTLDESNSILCIQSGNAPEYWLVSGESATLQVFPKDAPGSGVFVMVDGRPLRRGGLDGTNLWILNKDKWERVTDRSGAPLSIATGTTYNPAGAVKAVGAVLWIDNSGPGKGSPLLFSIKGKTAEQVVIPEGVTGARLMKLGKTAVVAAKDNGKDVLLTVQGTKLKALKGAPTGDVTFSDQGDVILAGERDAKAGVRYYRVDEKGSREIKVPKGQSVTMSLVSMDSAGSAMFCRGLAMESGDGRHMHWRVDEKAVLTPIKLEPAGGGTADTVHWLVASDGAYLYLENGKVPPRFIPAR